MFTLESFHLKNISVGNINTEIFWNLFYIFDIFKYIYPYRCTDIKPIHKNVYCKHVPLNILMYFILVTVLTNFTTLDHKQSDRQTGR